MLYRYVVFIVLSFLVGCAHKVITPEERMDNADQMALAVNWEKQTLDTAPLDLVAYTPENKRKSMVLTVYIEGDGLAWITKNQVSKDPTPQHPIGLELALNHPTGTAVYLARPCQYFGSANAKNCDNSYWTSGRFSTNVITSTQQAINKLMKQFGADRLQLVGYSGGGAVASLVAAQRSDVIGLITVAGNLDHKVWTREHRISPLYLSQNPADYWRSLKDIPQVHFVGGQDSVVGKHIAESYRSHFPDNKKPSIVVIDDFDHSCCWAQQWQKLMGSARYYLKAR